MGAGLADELLVYLAPSLLGEAQGMVHLPALSDLAQAQKLKFIEVAQIGDDVRILARVIALMFTGIVAGVGRIVEVERLVC